MRPVRREAAEAALAELRAKVEDERRRAGMVTPEDPELTYQEGYADALDVVLSLLPENGEQP